MKSVLALAAILAASVSIVVSFHCDVDEEHIGAVVYDDKHVFYIRSVPLLSRSECAEYCCSTDECNMIVSREEQSECTLLTLKGNQTDVKFTNDSAAISVLISPLLMRRFFIHTEKIISDFYQTQRH